LNEPEDNFPTTLLNQELTFRAPYPIVRSE